VTLRVLAARTDFTPSFILQIENRQYSPSISSMEKIANALGVTLAEFFLSVNKQVVNIVRPAFTVAVLKVLLNPAYDEKQ
jgi:XRE family transcriptional regulator, regulator of sulfur utilization